jgi:hypothetical protein
MGPDLRDAIEAMPGLGGVALWVKFLDSDDPELIACTDGIHVEAGPLYEKYDDAERRFIVLRELLHVALAHPARGREMNRRTEGFESRLYNIACDAIINAALDGAPGVHIPDGALTLGDLLAPLGRWKKDDHPAEVVRQWSSEALYHLLANNREQIDLRALGPNAGFDGRDLAPAMGSSQSEGDGSTDEEIRAWSSRLKMARGSLAGIFNHAYTPASIKRAIAAGVKCIEHGHLMDEATARLIANRGVWLSIQPFPDELADAFPPGSQERAKAFEVFAGMDVAYRLARKHKLKTAWGTDIIFSPGLAPRQGELLAKLERWYTPAEALVMATGTNGELLAMSGNRNPYPGKLGVVEEGALADLLLVDGDPVKNIKLIADPAKNFVVIMKDGKIYKNLIR